MTVTHSSTPSPPLGLFPSTVYCSLCICEFVSEIEDWIESEIDIVEVDLLDSLPILPFLYLLFPFYFFPHFFLHFFNTIFFPNYFRIFDPNHWAHF